MNGIVLYHGSGIIIEKPSYEMGRVYNDFGKGFYCTEDLQLAKEWASAYENAACVNKYSLDISGLRIVDFTTCAYSVLNWVALVADNREFSLDSTLKEKLDRFVSKYIKGLKKADVIIGWRGDDSYFSCFKDFVNNRISYECLEYILRNNRENTQIVLKSKRAIDALEFLSEERVDYIEHTTNRKTRDIKLINALENKKEEFANGKHFSDFV